jgi:hypothetical protein
MDETSYLVDEGEPRFELPRLQIVHLFAWTAAVAVAFLPYSIYPDMTAGVPWKQNVSNQAAAVAAMKDAWSGVVEGTFLFVALTFFHWKRQGRDLRRQPGHVLAFQGAALWAAAVVIRAIAMALTPQAPVGGPLGFVFLAVGFVFFVWFLRLARRRDEPRWWRRAFSVLAIAPGIGWGGMIAWVLINSFLRVPAGSRNPILGLVFAMGAPAVAQGAALGAAMLNDWQCRIPRHWSHWVACFARLAMSLDMIVSAALMALFYEP